MLWWHRCKRQSRARSVFPAKVPAKRKSEIESRESVITVGRACRAKLKFPETLSLKMMDPSMLTERLEGCDTEIEKSRETTADKCKG